MSRTAATKKIETAKKKRVAGTVESQAKATLNADWVGSSVGLERLTELQARGLLPSQKSIGWRFPLNETRPQPKENEVVVFADHVTRGFRPPGSRFFRSLLNFFGLCPQDLSANSVLNISNFTVFCEVYLQVEPSIPLFQEFFYGNKQTERSGGRPVECGAVSIQRRARRNFPKMKLHSRVKEWQRSFFYCKDTSPEGEPPLPGFREDRLTYSPILNSWPSTEDKKKLEPVLRRVDALLSHGLSAIDLVKCWVGWQIQPLSARSRLLCEYSGPGDDMSFSQVALGTTEVIQSVKKLLGESVAAISQVGLNPFWDRNRAPQVPYFITFDLW